MSEEEAAHAVKIAAELYRVRDAARELFGDEYEVQLRPLRRFVRQMATAERCSVLDIPPLVGARAQARGEPPLREATMLMLIAAAVEETEAKHVG